MIESALVKEKGEGRTKGDTEKDKNRRAVRRVALLRQNEAHCACGGKAKAGAVQRAGDGGRRKDRVGREVA